MAVEGYDLVMLGILAAAAVLGYFKGLLWQIAWIMGIVASSFVALRFGGPLAPFFGQTAPWNRLVAMLALYVGTSLAVWLTFRVVSGAVSAVQLSSFDHQLGLLFGLAKGALLCVVVTFFAVTLAPAYRERIVGSHSGRLVAELIVRADDFLPPDVVETVSPFVRQFEAQLRDPAAAAGPGAAGTPSPLQALWTTLTSSSAWTGPAEGTAPPGSRPMEQGARPAGGAWADPWQTPAPGNPAAQPVRPATSRFSAPPAAPQTPPGQFPVGSQTPLPIR